MNRSGRQKAFYIRGTDPAAPLLPHIWKEYSLFCTGRIPEESGGKGRKIFNG